MSEATPGFRAETLERDGYTCQYCSHTDESGITVKAHHIHQRGHGGGDELANSTTLCDRCHSAVHALGGGETRPVSILETKNVPKTRYEIRGLTAHANVMALNVLEEERRVNPLRVRGGTGLGSQRVNDALGSLVDAGWARRVNRGLYEFVEDPREADR